MTYHQIETEMAKIVETFHMEMISIMDIAIEATVAIVKGEKGCQCQARQVDFASVIQIMMKEAAGTILRLFKILTTQLIQENKMLKHQVSGNELQAGGKDKERVEQTGGQTSLVPAVLTTDVAEREEEMFLSKEPPKINPILATGQVIMDKGRLYKKLEHNFLMKVTGDAETKPADPKPAHALYRGSVYKLKPYDLAGVKKKQSPKQSETTNKANPDSDKEQAQAKMEEPAPESVPLKETNEMKAPGPDSMFLKETSEGISEAEAMSDGQGGSAESDTQSVHIESTQNDKQRTHRWLSKEDVKYFECDCCPQTFNSENGLKIHYSRIHQNTTRTPDGFFQCSTCGETFKYSTSLVVHCRIHTGERPFKCSQCDKAFKTRATLRQHERLHTAEKFICEICGASYNELRNLKYHLSVHRGEKPHSCKECGKSFMTRSALKTHTFAHQPLRPFMCKPCGKTFPSKYKLLFHQRQRLAADGEKKDGIVCYLRNETTPMHKRPFVCSTCQKRYISIKSLKVHEAVHTQPWKYDCVTCGKSFSRKHSLDNHQKLHSGVKRPSRCDVCGKSFSNEYTLKYHQRIHTGETKYRCDECGKSFFHKAPFDYHQKIHSGETPYGCDVCGKRFIREHSLKSHELRHTGEKPHQCEVCGQAFSLTHNLHRHMRIHTGEKPHKCDVCDKGFARRSQMKLHMQVHTGVRPYSCSTCGKGFSDSRPLKRHECGGSPISTQ